MKTDRSLLRLFRDPVLILTVQGEVVDMNAAGERLLGRGGRCRDVPSAIVTPPDELRAWLRRCSGTTGPLVGAIAVRGQDGDERRLVVFGARLDGDEKQPRVAVRCTIPESDRFSVLKKEVEQLNAEARERRRRQALLEEALRANELLLNELNHRVKNNIQIIISLCSAALRDAESPEVTRVLEALQGRLLAVGAVQDLLYEAQRMSVVPSAPFIRAVARAVAASLRPDVKLDVSVAEGEISSEIAFPLALILNELVTNAAKYGLPDGRGTIAIALERRDDGFSLVVHDSGPGIPDAARRRRSSGLGLVRGLCRQIGARLSIDNDRGARVAIAFAGDGGE